MPAITEHDYLKVRCGLGAREASVSHPCGPLCPGFLAHFQTCGIPCSMTKYGVPQISDGLGTVIVYPIENLKRRQKHIVVSDDFNILEASIRS